MPSAVLLLTAQALHLFACVERLQLQCCFVFKFLCHLMFLSFNDIYGLNELSEMHIAHASRHQSICRHVVALSDSSARMRCVACMHRLSAYMLTVNDDDAQQPGLHETWSSLVTQTCLKRVT